MSKNFANIYKPFRCTCFCCNRPEIHLSLGEEKTLVGKIVHQFTCCDPLFDIERNGEGGIDKYVKRINQDKTIGIIVCRRDDKYLIEYSSDSRIRITTYELV